MSVSATVKAIASIRSLRKGEKGMDDMKTTRKAFLSLRLPIIVGIVLGVLLFVSACGTSNQSISTTKPQAQAMQNVSMDASWPRLYHDLKSLKQDADLVVSGTFTGVAATVHPTKGPVETDYIFTVKKVLSTPRSSANVSSIIVRQTGGVANNVQYQIADDPLFTVGEQGVLFLHEFAPGHYFVIGGPTGRFQIVQGNMKSVGDEGVHLASSTSESAFYQSIQQA